MEYSELEKAMMVDEETTYIKLDKEIFGGVWLDVYQNTYNGIVNYFYLELGKDIDDSNNTLITSSTRKRSDVITLLGLSREFRKLMPIN